MTKKVFAVLVVVALFVGSSATTDDTVFAKENIVSPQDKNDFL
ncbi:hypothetical protein ACE1TF_15185 [Geomicrobium sp. JSM 1781026]|nr:MULTISPECIES: hypothetical protein [unclassified Geomicrobium]